MSDKSPPPLLSAEQAHGELKGLVEAFFLRKLKEPGTDKPAHQVLMKSPPGLGKTTQALEWAFKYQRRQESKAEKGEILELTWDDIGAHGVIAQTAIFAPRHYLAKQAKSLIESYSKKRGYPITVPILRGRGHEAEQGNAPCKRWKEAGAFARVGLPVYTNLCRRVFGDEAFECPYLPDCEYINSWRTARTSPFVILVHSYLGLDWAYTPKIPSLKMPGLEPEPDLEPATEHLFNPTQVAMVLCDEDPTPNLVEETWLSEADVKAISRQGLREAIIAGLHDAEGLLSHLRAQAISVSNVRAVAEELKKEEAQRGRIVKPSDQDTVILEGLKGANRLVRLSRVLHRLADELECGRQGPSYSLLFDDTGRLVAQGRRPWPYQQRLLILDGTANPDILRQFIPGLGAVPVIHVERNIHITQVSNMTFYMGSLIEPDGSSGSGKWKPSPRLEEVGNFIAMVAPQGRTLVVTNKRVRCALTGENANESLPVSGPYGGADVAHFGNLRGINDFENHENIVILGREELPVRAAERRAMAIWYDTAEPIRRIEANPAGQVNYVPAF